MKNLILITALIFNVSAFSQETKTVEGEWWYTVDLRKENICADPDENGSKWLFKADGTYKAVLIIGINKTRESQSGTWRLEGNTLYTKIDPINSTIGPVEFNEEAYTIIWNSDDCFYIIMENKVDGSITGYRNYVRKK